MLQPEFKEFSRLAREATLVPVVKTVSADLLTPVSAFLAVAANEPDSFLLESVERGEQIGRYTFVGARPYMRLWAQGDEIHIERGKVRQRRTGDVFATIKELLRSHRPAHYRRTAAVHLRRRRILCLRRRAPPRIDWRACQGRCSGS